MANPVRTIFVMILLGLALACGTPKVIRDSAAVADQLYQAGDYQQALAAYQAMVQTYPSAPESARAYYRIAELYYFLEEPEPALAWCNSLNQRFGPTSYSQQGELLRARIYLFLQDKITAHRILKSFLLQQPEEQLRLSAFTLLAELAFEAEEYGNAANYYSQAAATKNPKVRGELLLKAGEAHSRNGNLKEAQRALNQALALDLQDQTPWLYGAYIFAGDVHAADQKFIQALELYAQALHIAVAPSEVEAAIVKLNEVIERFDAAALTTLAQRYRASTVGALIGLRQATILRRNDRLSEAQQILENLSGGSYPQVLVDRVLADLEMTRQEQEVAKNKIGVLLPLSGRVSVFGESALQGIQLARARAQARAQHYTLVIRDTEGQPELAVKLAEELITQEKVIAIIGPLLSTCLNHCMPLADTYQVPFFTPGGADVELSAKSTPVFRNCLTNQVEGQAIAEFAVNVLGITKLAILYPDNAYGRELRDVFSHTAEALDARIVVALPYSESTTDFRRVIIPLKNEAIEGIFIPDYAETVGLLAPQLPFHEIMDVVLLGTSGWNDPALVSIAGRYIEGAFFTEPYFTGDQYPPVAAFLKDFQKMFLEKPSILSVQSYEAASIIMTAVEAGSVTRASLIRYLKSTREFPGVSGPLLQNEQGDLQRHISILQVNRGQMTVFQ